jgi:RES domain-containing protein
LGTICPVLDFDPVLEKKLTAEIDRLSEVLTRTWRKPVYRCVDLKWARPEYLVSGEGSQLFGSRWMAPKRERTVYAASSEALALKESRRLFADYGIAKPLQKPRVSVEIALKLDRVADLTRLPALTDWPILEELLAEDWEHCNDQGQESLSQLLGFACFQQGFEALVIPSARDKRGRNIAWFPSLHRYSSTIQISGQQELTDWLKPH